MCIMYIQIQKVSQFCKKFIYMKWCSIFLHHAKHAPKRPLYSITHLVGEQRDETFGFSLQVQVHVKQLSIECLVNLLLPLHPTGLLHGPLHTLPVQVTGQVTQENANMLCVVQGDAELAESQEEQKRRNRGWRWRNKEGKEAGLQRSGGMGCECKWLTTTGNCFFLCKHIWSPAEPFVLPERTLADIYFPCYCVPSPSSVSLQALPALWSSCGLGPTGSSQSCVLSSLSSRQPRCRNSATDKITVLLLQWNFLFDFDSNASALFN